MGKTMETAQEKQREQQQVIKSAQSHYVYTKTLEYKCKNLPYYYAGRCTWCMEPSRYYTCQQTCMLSEPYLIKRVAKMAL